MIAFTSGLASLLVIAATGAAGLPFGVPPAPDDPAVARALPEGCLFCVSWAGTASPDANSRNQTEQLLAEPEVQNFLAQIGSTIRCGVKKGLQSEGPETATTAAELADALVTIPLHQGVVFVSQTSKPNAHASHEGREKTAPETVLGLLSPQLAERLSAQAMADFDIDMVVALGHDAAQIRAAARKWTEHSNGLKAAKDKQPPASGTKKADRSKDETKQPDSAWQIQEVTIDGQAWYRLTGLLDPPIIFGFHGDYLISANSEKAIQGIVGRMANSPPDWWSKIREQLPVQRRSIVTYVNLRLIKGLLSPPIAGKKAEIDAVFEMLGLSNASALIEVWGLEGEDFANQTLLVLDGKPRGLLRLVSDRPLQPEDLAVIPRDAAFAAAFRLDAQQALDIVLSSVEQIRPEFRKEATATIDKFEHAVGIDLRHGMLNFLGDTWCVYNSPSENGLVFTGLTAVAPLRDAAGMIAPYGRLMAVAKQWASAKKAGSSQSDADPPDISSPRLEQFSFAGSEVYCLNCGMFAPAWCMTKSEMVFSLSPQNIKAYLIRGGGHESISRLPRVAQLVSGDSRPALVAYGDSPRVFELLYPWLMMYGPAITTTVRANANPDADLSLMPSGLAISRHLGPSVAVLRRTEHGIEFVSRGTIPLPSAPAHVALWALGGFESPFPHAYAPPAAEAPPATTAAPGAPQPAAVPAQTPARAAPATVAPSGEAPRKPALPEGTKPGPAAAHQPQPGPRRNDGPARPANDRPTAQVHFGGPDGMTVSWDVKAPGAFDSEPLVCPANFNFPPGGTYRLKLSNIPGRPGLEFYPTLEVASTVPRTEAYLAHYAIPFAFTPEDFDQVTSGNFVAKVLYLPDPAFQELALAGVETLVSTRFEPGVDPIVEANRRGAILAIMRLGNKDLQAARRPQSGQHATVAPSPTQVALPRVVQAPK